MKTNPIENKIYTQLFKNNDISVFQNSKTDKIEIILYDNIKIAILPYFIKDDKYKFILKNNENNIRFSKKATTLIQGQEYKYDKNILDAVNRILKEHNIKTKNSYEYLGEINTSEIINEVFLLFCVEVENIKTDGKKLQLLEPEDFILNDESLVNSVYYRFTYKKIRSKK